MLLKLHAMAVALLVFALWAAWRISLRNARAACLCGTMDRALLWLLSFLQPVVREFARLRGMLLYAARPTWQPHLPDILPPLMPGKRSLQLATLAFWSETSRDRHHLLDALRAELAAKRRVYREDDGWRWFDIEMAPQADLSRALLTVTEYHGDGKCLTRVRCMLRLRHGLVWNLVLWLGFTGLLATLPLPAGWIGVIGGGGTLVAIPLVLRFIRRDLTAMVRRAAVEAGMPESTK
jgi:hypothetical protein